MPTNERVAPRAASPGRGGLGHGSCADDYEWTIYEPISLEISWTGLKVSQQSPQTNGLRMAGLFR
jgi:hypothetical protein